MAEEAERKEQNSASCCSNMVCRSFCIHHDNPQGIPTGLISSRALQGPAVSTICWFAPKQNSSMHCASSEEQGPAWVQLHLTVKIHPKTNHSQTDASQVGKGQSSQPQWQHTCLTTYSWPHNTAAKAHRKFAYTPNDLNHNGFYSCSKPRQRSLVGIFKYSLHQTCWVKNLPNRCCRAKPREASQQPAQGTKAGWQSLVQCIKGEPKLTHHLERTAFTHGRSIVRL